jgi:hypothetical protein
MYNKNYYVDEEDWAYNTPHSKRGICYFDIDGTLTHMQGNGEEIIQECIDKGFAVGIVTASGRTPEMVCEGDRSKVPWMPDNLCKYMNNNDFITYNSKRNLSGTPFNGYKNNNHGFIKGFQMSYTRDQHFAGVPDKCLVLFDNDISYIKGVKKYNPNLEVQCASPECGKTFLNKNMVQKKIDQMIRSGC